MDDRRSGWRDRRRDCGVHGHYGGNGRGGFDGSDDGGYCAGNDDGSSPRHSSSSPDQRRRSAPQPPPYRRHSNYAGGHPSRDRDSRSRHSRHGEHRHHRDDHQHRLRDDDDDDQRRPRDDESASGRERDDLGRSRMDDDFGRIPRPSPPSGGDRSYPRWDEPGHIVPRRSPVPTQHKNWEDGGDNSGKNDEGKSNDVDNAGVDEFGRRREEFSRPRPAPSGGAGGRSKFLPSGDARKPPEKLASIMRRGSGTAEDVADGGGETKDGNDFQPKKSLRFAPRTDTTTVERYIESIGTAFGTPSLQPPQPPPPCPPPPMDPPPPIIPPITRVPYGNQSWCRYHPGEHFWRDCPNNPRSRYFKGEDITASQTCRYHRDHLWRDCPNNPRSKNFGGVKTHRTASYLSDFRSEAPVRQNDPEKNLMTPKNGASGMTPVAGSADSTGEGTTSRGSRQMKRAIKAGRTSDQAEVVAAAKAADKEKALELLKAAKAARRGGCASNGVAKASTRKANVAEAALAALADSPAASDADNGKKHTGARKQPFASKNKSSARTSALAGGSSMFNTSNAARPIPRNIPSETSLVGSLGAKPSVKAARAAAKDMGSSRLFNTSDAARSVPRKTPSETSLVGRQATAKSSRTVATARGASHLFNTSNVARPILRKNPSETSAGSKRPASEKGGSPGSIPLRHSHSATVSSVPLAGADLSANVNFHGRWRSRTRAPVGVGAVPLTKHEGSRVARQGNRSVFTPPRGEGLGGGGGGGGGDPGSTGTPASTASSAALGSPTRGGKLSAKGKSPGEIALSELYDTESEGDTSTSEVDIDRSGGESDGGSVRQNILNANGKARKRPKAEDGSVEREAAPGRKRSAEVIVLDDSSDEDEEGGSRDDRGGEGSANESVDSSMDRSRERSASLQQYHFQERLERTERIERARGDERGVDGGNDEGEIDGPVHEEEDSEKADGDGSHGEKGQNGRAHVEDRDAVEHEVAGKKDETERARVRKGGVQNDKDDEEGEAPEHEEEAEDGDFDRKMPNEKSRAAAEREGGIRKSKSERARVDKGDEGITENDGNNRDGDAPESEEERAEGTEDEGGGKESDADPILRESGLPAEEKNDKDEEEGDDDRGDEAKCDATERDDAAAGIPREDDAAAKMESDLFDLIERTIEIWARWEGRLSSAFSLKFGEEPPGDTSPGQGLPERETVGGGRKEGAENADGDPTDDSSMDVSNAEETADKSASGTAPGRKLWSEPGEEPSTNKISSEDKRASESNVHGKRKKSKDLTGACKIGHEDESASEVDERRRRRESNDPPRAYETSREDSSEVGPRSGGSVSDADEETPPSSSSATKEKEKADDGSDDAAARSDEEVNIPTSAADKIDVGGAQGVDENLKAGAEVEESPVVSSAKSEDKSDKENDLVRNDVRMVSDDLMALAGTAPNSRPGVDETPMASANGKHMQIGEEARKDENNDSVQVDDEDVPRDKANGNGGVHDALEASAASAPARTSRGGAAEMEGLATLGAHDCNALEASAAPAASAAAEEGSAASALNQETRRVEDEKMLRKEGKKLRVEKLKQQKKERKQQKKERKQQKKRKLAEKKRKISREGEGGRDDSKKRKRGLAIGGRGGEDDWTEEERRLYREGVEACGGTDWGRIARDHVRSRTPLQIREFARRGESGKREKKQKVGNQHFQEGESRNEAKKQKQDDEPWTEDEQGLHREAVGKCGNNWGKIASRRCAKAKRQQHAQPEESNVPVNDGKEMVQAMEVGDDAINGNHSNREEHPREPRYNWDEGNRLGEDSDSQSGDDDDDVPAFLTCNVCGMAFCDTREAWEHENDCAIMDAEILEGGRIFVEKHALMRFVAREGKMIHEDDMIFFRPDLMAPRKDGEGRRSVSPDDDVDRRPADVGDVQQPDDAGDNRQDDDEDSDVDSAGNSVRNATRSPLIDVASGQDSPKRHVNEAQGCDDEAYAYWDDDEVDMPSYDNEMNLVKHLCSTSMDPETGLPTQKLTVMCGESETLYDFEVNIEQSSIENAGYGAFLTYLGARILKDRASSRSDRLMKRHCVDDSICTHNPLVAQTIGGRNMSVELTGNNLHYNNNSIYWSKKVADKFEELQLKEDSPISFDENEVRCKVHEEVKKLRAKIPDGNGIGFLGIHTESDYIPADDEMFCNSPNAFELGRYGPHRPDDRKTNLHFDFKNFIHNFEPSEWSYEVPEPMLNHRQIVDITDDTTGEVHSIAKRHTPTYVNEIGHNPELRSNVLIRDKNDRSVYYYVCIDRDQQLKKGDTVELFVNYGDNYEQVRERKGYGKANISEQLGGDEEDGARLRRNFQEREEMEKDIYSLQVYEMFHLVEFISKKIFDRVNTLICSSLNADKLGNRKLDRVSMRRTLIARRRLHWIGERLAGRVQQFIADPTVDNKSECIDSIRESLRDWRFVQMPMIFNRPNSDLRNVLLGELSEELLFRARSRLPSPLDENVWSNLAIDLTRKSTQSMAQYLYCYSGPIEMRKQYIVEDLLKHAKNAAVAVRNGSNAINNMNRNSDTKALMDNHINLLSFKSPQRAIKKENLLDESKEKMMSIYDAQNTIKFGTAAAMADIQAYYDAVELCGIDSYYIPGNTRAVYECGRSIVSQYGPNSTSDSPKHSPQFYWMARSIDAFKKGDARVNEQWYLENQVLAIVHILATTCVNWRHSGSETRSDLYTLEKLCREIKLDSRNAKKILSQDVVTPTWPEPEIKAAYSPALSDNGQAKGSRRARCKARKTSGASCWARIGKEAANK